MMRLAGLTGVSIRWRALLDYRAPPAGRNAHRHNLVNATAIEIDDLETPALAVETFADVRQMTELIEHESRCRMIATLLWDCDGQPVGHLIDRHAARDQP